MWLSESLTWECRVSHLWKLLSAALFKFMPHCEFLSCSGVFYDPTALINICANGLRWATCLALFSPWKWSFPCALVFVPPPAALHATSRSLTVNCCRLAVTVDIGRAITGGELTGTFKRNCDKYRVATDSGEVSLRQLLCLQAKTVRPFLSKAPALRSFSIPIFLLQC